jgi:hypothetical protein
VNAARQKVEDEGECRVCGEPADRCDAAHTWDRATAGGDFTEPALVVPLCAKIKGGAGCHDLYDAHKLDLLPYLRLDEQVAMVKAAGGIERARKRAVGRGL